jgi:hypothetical protein
MQCRGFYAWKSSRSRCSSYTTLRQLTGQSVLDLKSLLKSYRRVLSYDLAGDPKKIVSLYLDISRALGLVSCLCTRDKAKV